MIKTISTCLKISLKKTLEYKFESFMLLFHLVFNLLFLIIFWSAIGNNFNIPNGYSLNDMYLYSGLIMFSSAIFNFLYSVNILPYSINEGDLDQYLIKPKNWILLYALDNMNIVAVIEGLLLSIAFLSVIIYNYGYSFYLILVSLFFIIIGCLILTLIYGIVAVLSFWFGKTVGILNLLYSFNDIKNYPLGIFPTSIKNFFLYIIPLGFVSYFPLEICLQRVDSINKIVLIYVLSFLILLMIFIFIVKKGVKHYESNN